MNKRSILILIVTGICTFMTSSVALAAPVMSSWFNAQDGRHLVVSGEPATLTAVVDSTSANLTYQWNFGDNTPTSNETVLTNSYVIEETHTYNQPHGTRLSATISVYDNGDLLGTDTYRIKVVDPDPLVNGRITNHRRKIAIANGLWWLHSKLERRTLPGGVEMATVGALISDEYDEGIIMAAQAFVDAGFLVKGDSDNPYTEDVIDLVNFVTSWLAIMPLDKGTDEDNDPEDRDSGPVGMIDNLGVFFAAFNETEYGFGPALRLLATCGYGAGDNILAFDDSLNFSGGAVASLSDWNFLQVMQQMVDWIAWAQLEICGNTYPRPHRLPVKDCEATIDPNLRGGWPYYREGWERGTYGDNSISWWTVSGLQAVDVLEPNPLPYPEFVKEELEGFVLRNRDALTGEVFYGKARAYHLVERAGLGLSLLAYLGYDKKTDEAKATKNFLKNNWSMHNLQHGQSHPGTSLSGDAPCLDDLGLPQDCYSHYSENYTFESGYHNCVNYVCNETDPGTGECISRPRDCIEYEWMPVTFNQDLNLFGMMTVTEGLKVQGIKRVPSNEDRFGAIYRQLLIENQFPNGAWDDSGWSDGNPLGTTWAIQTLLKL